MISHKKCWSEKWNNMKYDRDMHAVLATRTFPCALNNTPHPCPYPRPCPCIYTVAGCYRSPVNIVPYVLCSGYSLCVYVCLCVCVCVCVWMYEFVKRKRRGEEEEEERQIKNKVKKRKKKIIELLYRTSLSLWIFDDFSSSFPSPSSSPIFPTFVSFSLPSSFKVCSIHLEMLL